MNLTNYGHSCFGVVVSGKTLLFDPFISGNELAKDINTGSKMVETKLVIGVHYDTFDFIKIDHQKAIDLFKSNELELKLLATGETFNVDCR